MPWASMMDRGSRTPRPGHVSWATIWMIVLSSAPFVQFSIHLQHSALDPGTWSYVYPYWGVAVVGVALFVAHVWHDYDRRAVLVRIAPCVPLALWLLVSVSWGDSDYTAPRETLLIVALLPGAWWFGAALRIEEQVLALFIAMHCLVLMSLFAVWRWSDTATGQGNWNGVFANRNSLGPVAGMAALSWLGLCLLVGRRWLIPVAVVLSMLDLFVLAQSGSDTAWFAVAAAIGTFGVVVLVRGLRRRHVRGAVVIAGGVVVAIIGWFLFFTFIGPITGAFGKDETLSGRRVVWQYLREATASRRWHGFGYGSFWEDPTLVYALYQRTLTIYDSAHSTLMETYVALGIVGVSFLLLIAAQALVVVSWTIWAGARLTAIWWSTALAFVVVENLTESLIGYHSFMWLLVVAAGWLVVATASNVPTLDEGTLE